MRPAAPVTGVDVEAGRILVRPSFANLLVCRNVPGGSWDAVRKAWSFPATREHAQRLQTVLRVVRMTPRFAEAFPAAAVQGQAPVVPPEPVDVAAPHPKAVIPAPEPDVPMPAGLLTRPWRHQKAAVKFCQAKFASGMHGILLAMGMGTGKSLVACILMLMLAARRVLIACPLRVVPVWVTQFERHVGIPVILVALDEDARSVAHKLEIAKEKMRLAEALGQPFVAVINYDSAWREPFASWAEKQRWNLVIADECVPADTMIATPWGEVPIQFIEEGATVLGVDARGRIVAARVTGTFRRFSKRPLVQIDSLLSTDNHPVWVEHRGYVPAAEVCTGDRVLVYGEDDHCCLRIVRSVYHEDDIRRVASAVLREVVLRQMEDVEAGVRGRAPRTSGSGCTVRSDETQLGESGVRCPASLVPPLRTKSIPRPGNQGQGHRGLAGAGVSDAERREWDRPESAAANACRAAGLGDGVRCADAHAPRFGLSVALQAGHSESAGNGRGGSGWAESSFEIQAPAGREERRVPGVLWLDRHPRDERGSSGELRSSGAAHLVFNLETSTGNYFANRILVHNCHRLKSPGGKASLFFKRMRARAEYRVGLTGTPMPHGPLDEYAIFRFLDIRIFGPSFSAFRQKYALMGGFQRKQITGFQRLDELEKLMSRITFRVGKEVLDLPPETHVTYYCELSPEAARIYRDLEEDFVAQVRNGIVTAANALVKLLRLQQVAGGYVPTDDHVGHRIDTAKQKLLADTLEDMSADEPVVVFCRFHADLDAVHDACQTVGYTSLELSGRRDELPEWQAGRAQVLAVQISSGGVGVDLTRARFSIYYSLSFSLGEYDQSLSRVHRPGQTRPVEHVHLVARNTVDMKIMRALEKRAEVIASILAEIKN